MTDTLMRHLEMLMMVPRYPKTISTVELQEKLAEQGYEINLRSIQRDLEKLSIRFPLVVDESARPYLWSFSADAALKLIPTLDTATAITLELARSYLTPILPHAILEHLKPYFAEAHEVLNKTGHPLSNWPGKIRLINNVIGKQHLEIDSEILELLTEAVINEFQCEIVYKARHWSNSEKITIHPLGLVYRAPNTYLIATIDGREGVRQLALHRVESVQRLERKINTPTGFDLDDYIAGGEMKVLHSMEKVQLELRCDKPMLNHLLESELAEDQVVVKETDDSFEIHCTVHNSYALRWWLISQSAHLTVMSPKWLNEELVKTLQVAIDRQ
jgi:predicted DNA-binding transcriptional regulator YafY